MAIFSNNIRFGRKGWDGEHWVTIYNSKTSKKEMKLFDRNGQLLEHKQSVTSGTWPTSTHLGITSDGHYIVMTAAFDEDNTTTTNKPVKIEIAKYKINDFGTTNEAVAVHTTSKSIDFMFSNIAQSIIDRKAYMYGEYIYILLQVEIKTSSSTNYDNTYEVYRWNYVTGGELELVSHKNALAMGYFSSIQSEIGQYEGKLYYHTLEVTSTSSPKYTMSTYVLDANTFEELNSYQQTVSSTSALWPTMIIGKTEGDLLFGISSSGTFSINPTTGETKKIKSTVTAGVINTNIDETKITNGVIFIEKQNNSLKIYELPRSISHEFVYDFDACDEGVSIKGLFGNIARVWFNNDVENDPLFPVICDSSGGSESFADAYKLVSMYLKIRANLSDSIGN